MTFSDLLPSRLRPTMSRRLLNVAVVLTAFLAVFFPAGPLAAQAGELGRQTLGRPYWHVFLAYAVVIGFIAGWVISIARRLARIERRLPELDE